MKPIVYFRGDRQKGPELIKALEALGAKNPYNHTGRRKEQCYLIDVHGVIKRQSLLRLQDCLELAGQEVRI